MFNRNSTFDKELKRAEKSARAFAKRNRKEAKEVDRIMNGKTRTSDYNNEINKSGSAGNETLQFFMGFLLLGGGLYWLLNSFTVSSGMGGYGMYSLFGMRISGGVMLIPLLLGIGLIFFLDGKKRFIGYAMTALGLFVIVISLLSTLQFHAKYGETLYVYVLMLGMIAAGAGLLIKSTFKKKS